MLYAPGPAQHKHAAPGTPGARHHVLSPPALPWKPLSYFFFSFFPPIFFLGRFSLLHTREQSERTRPAAGSLKPAPCSLRPPLLVVKGRFPHLRLDPRVPGGVGGSGRLEAPLHSAARRGQQQLRRGSGSRVAARRQGQSPGGTGEGAGGRPAGPGHRRRVPNGGRRQRRGRAGRSLRAGVGVGKGGSGRWHLPGHGPRRPFGWGEDEERRLELVGLVLGDLQLLLGDLVLRQGAAVKRRRGGFGGPAGTLDGVPGDHG